MATWKERRAALEQNSTAKMIWTVLLILELIAVVLTVLVLIAGSIFLGTATGSGAGIFAGLAAIIGFLILGFQALIIWGIWRLEKWIQWFMWLNVLFSLPSLMGKSFYNGLLPILIAVGYTWVLMQLKKAPVQVPPAVPPTTPQQ